MSSRADLVLAAEERRSAAMLAADVTTLDALIDDGCRYIHSSGGVDTKADYLDHLRTGALVYTAISNTEHTVVEHPGCILVYFRFDATAQVGGADREIAARCTAVYSTDEQPRLLSFQSTTVAAH